MVSVGFGIIIIVAVVIPSAMLVVGMVFKHECPYNEDIPTFLLVGGGVGALKHLLYLSSLMCCSKEEDRLRQTGIQSFLTNFLLIWLTFGSLWLNRNNPDNTSFDPSSKYYCNEFLFNFAMGLAMAVHICLFAAAFFLSSAIIVAFLYHVYHHIRS